MSDEITVEQRDPQPICSTRFECRPDALGDHLEKMLPPVMAYIKAQDGEVCGPPFLRYHALFDERFHLELGYPVETPIAARAMFEANELPGGDVVTVTHIGAYSGLGKVHRRIRDWIREHEWKPAGPAWDFYLNDPKEIDPDSLKTRVVYPVTEPE